MTSDQPTSGAPALGRAVAAAAVALLAATSCSGGTVDDDASSAGQDIASSVATAVVDTTLGDTAADESELAFDLDPVDIGQDGVSDEGVLEAAIIILTAGDLEGALAEGRITEAEVDVAIAALDDGTIAFYVG